MFGATIAQLGCIEEVRADTLSVAGVPSFARNACSRATASRQKLPIPRRRPESEAPIWQETVSPERLQRLFAANAIRTRGPTVRQKVRRLATSLCRVASDQFETEVNFRRGLIR